MSPAQGKSACYIAFGRAMGNMAEFGGWIDVHGAGAQRSDPKAGDPDDPMYANGFGPQGDAIRIYNYVRLVRDIGTTSGLNQAQVQNDLKINPNPATSFIRIELPDGTGNVSVEIFDTRGASVYRQILDSGAIPQIDVSGFPKGVYVVRISDGENVRSGKFMVQ